MDYFMLTSAWTEPLVTFNSQPTFGLPFAINVAVGGSGFFETVDATTVVKSWVAVPANNFGVELRAALAEPTVLELASRENSINHPAFLEITTTTTTTQTPEPASVSLLLIAMAGIGLAVRKTRHNSRP
jgi:hypothetical protein